MHLTQPALRESHVGNRSYIGSVRHPVEGALQPGQFRMVVLLLYEVQNSNNNGINNDAPEPQAKPQMTVNFWFQHDGRVYS